MTTGIDPVTGSTSATTTWPFGLTTGPRSWTSPLEGRFRRAGVQWTPTWQVFSVRGRNVYGFTIERGCGQMPAVGHLHGDFATMVAETATDAELRALAHSLQTGTPAQQQDAVQAIGMDAIDRHSNRP